MTAPACPHPDKTAYRSKQAAHRAVKLLTRNHADSGPGRLHAYCCPCRAHWHVGHTTY